VGPSFSPQGGSCFLYKQTSTSKAREKKENWGKKDQGEKKISEKNQPLGLRADPARKHRFARREELKLLAGASMYVKGRGMTDLELALTARATKPCYPKMELCAGPEKKKSIHSEKAGKVKFKRLNIRMTLLPGGGGRPSLFGRD